MVSCPYAWKPVVVVGTLVLLTNVYLALIALVVLLLAAVTALTPPRRQRLRRSLPTPTACQAAPARWRPLDHDARDTRQER